MKALLSIVMWKWMLYKAACTNAGHTNALLAVERMFDIAMKYVQLHLYSQCTETQSFRFSHLMSLNQSPFFYLHSVLGLGHFLCPKSQIPLSTYAFSKGLCSRQSRTTKQSVRKVVLNILVWKHMDHRQIECASVCDTPSSEWLHFVLDPYLSLNWIVLPICTQATLFQYYANPIFFQGQWLFSAANFPIS